MKKILLFFLVSVTQFTLMAQVPIAYYPFDGNAIDAAGVLNGTVSGATLTADRFGNPNSAYNFDGVDDFIATSGLALSQNQNWTMSAWVKPSSIAQNDAQILLNGFDNGSAGNGFGMVMGDATNSAPGNLLKLHYPGSGFVNSGFSFDNSGVWYHVAITRDVNGIGKLYFNGVLSGTTSSISINPAGGQLRIGSANGIRFWNGAIDEVKVFNTALTDASVLQEYSTGANYYSQFFNNVELDGLNDHIELGTSFSQQNFTIEMWVKPGKTQLNSATIIDNNDTGVQNWGCKQNGSITNEYIFGINASSGVTFTLLPNVWQHLALVKSATSVEVYINGIQKQSSPVVGDLIITGQSLRLGNGVGGGRQWRGKIDDVRFWNGVRTPTQLVASMNTQLTGNEVDLAGYWDMNRDGQGTGLTVMNKAVNTGAALNGITVGTATTPIFEPGVAVAQKKAGSGNAIGFDGINDAIEISNIAFNDFTYELWIKTSQVGPNPNAHAWDGVGIISSDLGSTSNGDFVPMALNGNFISFGTGDNGDLTLTSTVPINDNRWHHVAVTRNQVTGVKNIFIDGMLDVSASGSTVPYNANPSMYIGADFVDNVFFNGLLDEVRIWNTALSESQIQERMCHKISSADALYNNLVAYYNFDESTGNIAFDAIASANNGLLINNPARVASGAAIGDASSSDYVNVIKTVALTHPTGESFSATSTAGTPDGLHVYRVDEQPNTLAGTTGVGTNNKYFGVFQVGGTAPEYTGVYNYDPSTGAEGDFRLFKRNDNAAIGWTQVSDLPDQVDNTISTTGQSTEYILGSLGSPLPVRLLTFSGNHEGDTHVLQWETAMETNSDYFQIEQSRDAKSFVSVGKVWAGGSGKNIYSFTYPVGAGSGYYYYRLKMVDADGSYGLSRIVTLTDQIDKNLSFYPNPVSHTLTIGGMDETGLLRVVTKEGGILKQQTTNAGTVNLDLGNYRPGIYILQYIFDGGVINKKILKN